MNCFNLYTIIFDNFEKIYIFFMMKKYYNNIIVNVVSVKFATLLITLQADFRKTTAAWSAEFIANVRLYRVYLGT